MPHSAAGCRIDPPVSEPSAHGTLPAATVAALPPLLPPGTRSTSHGLPTAPNAEFSLDDPMANSSQLVLPTHTAPASNRRCTAVPVYGGLNPSRIRDAAVVSTPSTQRTSFSAMGMPQSAGASPGRSRRTRAAASACRSARSRVVRRYACVLGLTDSTWASVCSSSARGVVLPSRSAAPSSRMVLGVKLALLNRTHDEILPVARRGVGEGTRGAERCCGHVFAHHVDEV